MVQVNAEHGNYQVVNEEDEDEQASRSESELNLMDLEELCVKSRLNAPLIHSANKFQVDIQPKHQLLQDQSPPQASAKSRFNLSLSSPLRANDQII